jgi:hypothetical protein
LLLKKLYLTESDILGTYCRSTLRAALPTELSECPPGSRLRALLPLPVEGESVEEFEWDCRTAGKSFRGSHLKDGRSLRRAASIKAWVWVICTSLNHLYTGRFASSPLRGLAGPSSPAQVIAIHNIEKDVLRFLEANPGTLPGRNWHRHLEVSGVSYAGHEVALARPITLAQIQPALPKKGLCGSLSTVDFAEADVREALLDLTLSIRVG